MNLFNLVKLLVYASAVLLLNGCFDEKKPISEENLPEVNNKNCLPENISKIEDEEIRREFATRCATRSRFKKSPERDLTDWIHKPTKKENEEQ